MYEEELKGFGIDTEPDDRPGQYRIPAEAAIPAGWTSAGIISSMRAGRSVNLRIIRKVSAGARLGQETGVTGKDIVPVPTHTAIQNGTNR